jgi:hypothetical protein
MRTVAAAESMAVTAILWVRDLRTAAVDAAVDIKNTLLYRNTRRPFIFGVSPQKSAARRANTTIFFHPDCHCRYRSHTGSTLFVALADYTAGGDLHPALKMRVSVVMVYYTRLRQKCKCFFPPVPASREKNNAPLFFSNDACLAYKSLLVYDTINA